MPNPQFGTVLHERVGLLLGALPRCRRRSRSQPPSSIGLTSTQINAGALTDPANAFNAIVIPRQYNIAADQHDRRAHPDVRQQRRALPELLHRRDDERPQRRHHAPWTPSRYRDGTERRARGHHAGLDVRRRVRHQQPDRVGLRQGRVPLPRPGSQQRDLRAGIAGRRHRYGQHDGAGRDRADPLRGRRRRATASSRTASVRAGSTGGPLWSTSRSAPAACSCSQGTRSSGRGTSRSSARRSTRCCTRWVRCFPRIRFRPPTAPAPVEHRAVRPARRPRRSTARRSSRPVSRSRPRSCRSSSTARSVSQDRSGDDVRITVLPVRRQGAAPGRRPRAAVQGGHEAGRLLTRPARASRSSSRACGRSSTSTSARSMFAPIMRDLSRNKVRPIVARL